MTGVRFGGADTRTIRFLEGKELFIAFWLHRDQERAYRYIIDERLAKPGRSWRKSPELIEDLRAACPNDGQGVTDDDVWEAFLYAACRASVYARISVMNEGRIYWMRIRNAGCETETCRRLEGKRINVQLATTAIERLLNLSAVEQGLELSKRLISPKTPNIVNQLTSGEEIWNEYVANNYAFPPFYPGCFCKVEGVIEV